MYAPKLEDYRKVKPTDTDPSLILTWVSWPRSRSRLGQTGKRRGVGPAHPWR